MASLKPSTSSRHLSTEEVLALLEPEEWEVDDPNEVLLEGSDEEFEDLDELENGTDNSSNNIQFVNTTAISFRYGRSVPDRGQF